jgi:predicted DNA-binding protein
MTQDMKTRLLAAVDLIAPQNKGSLYLKVKEVIEKHIEEESNWLEAAKPQVRIHRSNEACVACEG